MLMLTPEQVKTLKQLNVSKDTDKTKERIAADFKKAKRTDQKAIVELSGQKRYSIYRVFNMGTVNARIVLAMAQVLNINPAYYTGETDERDEGGEQSVIEFLQAHGYTKLVKEMNGTGKRRGRKPKEKPAETEAVSNVSDISESTAEAEAQDPETAEEADFELAFSDEPQMKKAVDELTEQDAMNLLHTLFIRAKGGGEAAFIAEVVKLCLLK